MLWVYMRRRTRFRNWSTKIVVLIELGPYDASASWGGMASGPGVVRAMWTCSGEKDCLAVGVDLVDAQGEIVDVVIREAGSMLHDRVPDRGDVAAAWVYLPNDKCQELDW